MASAGSGLGIAAAVPNQTANQTGIPIRAYGPGYGPGYGSYAPPSYFEDEEEEGYESDGSVKKLSEIKITIKCPLYILGDSNVVAVDTAASANRIASGVVGSLKGMSMNGHGVPMIDENGRPRPITVTAIAEVRVDGSNNVVGEKAQPYFPRTPTQRAEDNKEGEGFKGTKKRERGSDEDESTGKRFRLATS